MKKNYLKYIWPLAYILLLCSCLMENPENKMQKLTDAYKNKDISNSQMLFGMGKIFRTNPDNLSIRHEYLQKMIISGYSSHVIHFYMDEREAPLHEKDMEILLFAIQKGNQYHLAEKFTGRFSGKYQKQLLALSGISDSLMHYNNLVKNNPGAVALEKRGKFFTRLNAADMANLDLDKSMHFDPCNPGALFEKSLALLNNEKTKEVKELLEKCNQNFETGQPQWYPVFYNLATEIEGLKKSNMPTDKVLFSQANLYINAGFPEVALRKSKELLKSAGNNNADYLALQGFIYFKMNKKELAMQYVSEAERISGKKSKLSAMIANMD